MYCLGHHSSVGASLACSSERLLISSMVCSVASTCLLGFTQSLRIPMLCSGFSSASHCVTHFAIPGGALCPPIYSLETMLCFHVSSFSFFWPQGRWVWLFCLLVEWSPCLKPWVVSQLSDQTLPCSRLRAPFWLSLPVSDSSGEEVWKSSLTCRFTFWSLYCFSLNWSPEWCQ